MSSLRDLHEYLADHAAELFLTLLGEPRTKSGREWRYGRKGSLAVVVAGEKAGVWKDHESDEGGGPLDLIARQTRTDIPGAIAWARDWAGGRLVDTPPAPRPASPPKQADAGMIDLARRLWDEAVPAVGTDAERYLRRRDITQGIHRTRYHPSVPMFGPDKRHRPHAAVLFRATNNAIQVVYLAHDGPRKADGLEAAKKTFGSIGGHAVLLQEGPGPLILLEGPETALSAVSAGVPGTIAAVLGASNFAKVGITSDADTLLLVGDGDPEGAPSRASLRKAARELTEAGKTVHVLELPPDGLDLNDILQARGPAALHELVLGALAGPPWTDPEANQEATPSPTSDPYYQSSPIAPAQATAQIEASVSAWLAEGCRRADAKARKDALVEELTPAIRAQVEAHVLAGQVLPEDAQSRINQRAGQQAAAQVRREFGADAFTPGPQLQIRAAAGTGKTTVVAKAIQGIDTARYPVWILVPTTTKAAEVQADIPGSFHVKGRTPEMCTRHELADAVAKAGANVQTSLCFNKATGAACPHFDDCPYQAQRRELEERKRTGAGGVYVGSHEYLKVPAGAPPPALLVVDESHWKTLLATIPIDPDSMDRFAHHSWREHPDDRDDGAGAGYTDNLEMDREARTRGLEFRSAVTSGLPILEELRARGFTSAQLRTAAKRLRRRAERITTIRPDMDDAAIRKLIEDRDAKQLAALAKLYEGLADELEVTPARGSTNGVEYRAPIGEVPGRVLVHYARQPNHRGGPVLLLDASADLAINRRLWSEDLQEVRIDVERRADVVQVVGKAFSNQSIKGVNVKGEPLRALEAKKLRQQIAMVTKNLPGPVLVVANKGAKESLETEVLESSGTDTLHMAHFGALRGLNQFQTCQSAVIVGREQPSAQAIEEYARALYRLDPAPMVTLDEYQRIHPVARKVGGGGRFVTGWAQETRHRRMAGGRVEAATVEVHPDPRAQRFLEQIREREIEQAIDRLRLIHASPQKPVILLSECVVDVTISRTVSWEQLTKACTRVDEALRIRGVLPLSWREAVRALGWSERIARDTLMVITARRDPMPNRSIYLATGPAWLVGYRTGRQRPQDPVQSALVRASSEAEARSRLEAITGPLTLFEVHEAPSATGSTPGAPEVPTMPVGLVAPPVLPAVSDAWPLPVPVSAPAPRSAAPAPTATHTGLTARTGLAGIWPGVLLKPARQAHLSCVDMAVLSAEDCGGRQDVTGVF